MAFMCGNSVRDGTASASETQGNGLFRVTLPLPRRPARKKQSLLTPHCSERTLLGAANAPSCIMKRTNLGPWAPTSSCGLANCSPRFLIHFCSLRVGQRAISCARGVGTVLPLGLELELGRELPRVPKVNKRLGAEGGSPLQDLGQRKAPGRP